MKVDIPQIELEKKIYERLQHIDKDIENLVRANYRLISMLVPAVKPTKREMEIFEKRKKESVIPLEKIEKRLRNG